MAMPDVRDCMGKSYFHPRTGAEPEQYEMAVIAAEAVGRVLFVETNSKQAPAWVDAVMPRGVPTVGFIPPNGGVHPSGDAA